MEENNQEQPQSPFGEPVRLPNSSEPPAESMRRAEPIQAQPVGAQSQQPYAQSQQPYTQSQQPNPYDYAAQARAQAQARQRSQQPPVQPPIWNAAPTQPQTIYQPVYVEAAKKSKAPMIIGAIVAVIALIALAVSVSSCSAAVLGMESMFYGMTSSGTSSTQGDSIAIIYLDGDIQYDYTACSPEGLSDLLDEAESNDDIKAVVLRVNSGGGTATAGEEMALELADFDKPVVVSSGSLNASAAYEISSQADYIYVNKTTEIGAIGTAMQVTDLSGLYDLLGIKITDITSAESKDSTYGTRALTDEELDYYQELVDTINDAFIENVATGRGMTEDAVREVATGLAFSGEQSVENGLADEVGTFDDAIAKAAELAGLSEGSYTTTVLDISSSGYSSLLGLLGSDVDDDMTVTELLQKLEDEKAAE